MNVFFLLNKLANKTIFLSGTSSTRTRNLFSIQSLFANLFEKSPICFVCMNIICVKVYVRGKRVFIFVRFAIFFLFSFVSQQNYSYLYYFIDSHHGCFNVDDEAFYSFNFQFFRMVHLFLLFFLRYYELILN